MLSKIKVLFQWSLRIAGVFLLLFLMLGAWVYTHKEEMIAMIKNGINEQLQAPVNISEIDLDFWATFPRVSLRLSEVSSQGYASETGDTLIAVQNIYLAVNLWELFQGEYVVEKILIEGGTCRIIEKGLESNYLIWKSDDEAESEVRFSIQEMELKKVRVQYRDNEMNVATFVSRGRIDLRLDEKDNLFQFDIQGVGLNYWSTAYTTKFQEEWDAIGKMSWKNDDFLVSVDKLKLPWIDGGGEVKFNSIDKLIVSISGKITDTEKAVVALAPEYSEFLNDYQLYGELNYHLKWEENHSIPLNLDLSMSKGSFNIVKSKAQIRELQFSANVSGNPESTSSIKIAVNDGSFELSGQKAKFSGVFRNPEQPFIQFKANINSSLSDLQSLVTLPMVSFTEGQAELIIDFKHQFKLWPPSKSDDFRGASINGSFDLSKAHFTVEGLGPEISQAEARFKFDDQTLVAEHLKGYIGTSDFVGNGYIDHFFSYLFAHQNLKLVANIDFGELDLLPFFSTAESNSDFEMPDYIQADLRLKAKELNFGSFSATQVETRILQASQSIQAEVSSLRSCGGQATGNVLFRPDGKNGYYLKVSSTIRGIDMPLALEAFDNFGQSTFTSQNMKGKANAEVVFENYLDRQLNPILDKIDCTAHLQISNGQLIDFEPFNSLSAFISLDELRDVKFSDLENVIHIKNGKMIIPEMQITSSVMSFTTSGEHDFNNNIRYYVKLQMSEILFRKQVKKQPDLEEHIVVVDHSPSPNLHFKITGNVDNPIVSYDMDGAKKGVRDKWVQEQKELKTILKQELKNDSTVVKTKTTDYTIEWDDDQKDESEPDF